jgi:hypothetical protein
MCGRYTLRRIHRPDEMEAYPVDARVNRATEDGAGLVERKSDERLGFNDEIRMTNDE